MNKRANAMICVTAFAFCALAGTAYAVTLNPGGGPPGSDYTAEVDCASEPTVYAVDLKAVPAATIVPKVGTESSPGTWTYDLHAGQYDQMVLSRCGAQKEQQRYDVDAPKLFPGPTVALWGDFDPRSSGRSVVGTDCPAGTTASVTLTGDGGYTTTLTADVDTYGNWEVPVPDVAPREVTATASCGDLDYDPIQVRRFVQPRTPPPGSGTTTQTTESSSPSTESSPPTESGPSTAQPVPGAPTYTG